MNFDNVLAIEPNSGLTINYALSFQYNYMFDSLVQSPFYPSYVYSIDYALDHDYVDNFFANLNILAAKKRAIELGCLITGFILIGAAVIMSIVLNVFFKAKKPESDFVSDSKQRIN